MDTSPRERAGGRRRRRLEALGTVSLIIGAVFVYGCVKGAAQVRVNVEPNSVRVEPNAIHTEILPGSSVKVQPKAVNTAERIGRVDQTITYSTPWWAIAFIAATFSVVLIAMKLMHNQMTKYRDLLTHVATTFHHTAPSAAEDLQTTLSPKDRRTVQKIIRPAFGVGGDRSASRGG